MCFDRGVSVLRLSSVNIRKNEPPHKISQHEPQPPVAVQTEYHEAGHHKHNPNGKRKSLAHEIGAKGKLGRHTVGVSMVLIWDFAENCGCVYEVTPILLRDETVCVCVAAKALWCLEAVHYRFY